MICSPNGISGDYFPSPDHLRFEGDLAKKFEVVGADWIHMILTNMEPNEWGRIVAIEGGHGLRQILLLRGVSGGCVVRMISCRGPVVIEVDRNIIALGSGMAQKIRVA